MGIDFSVGEARLAEIRREAGCEGCFGPFADEEPTVEGEKD